MKSQYNKWRLFIILNLQQIFFSGYGYRGMNTKCPHAIIMLTIQCIVSAIFDTWIIGIVYQRFARPEARTKTTLFSKNAVITRRDGKR